jgi:hypothetical protein
MGNLATAEALAMVRHYFADISKQQQQLLLDSWVDGVVSPAALEALCAEFDDVDGLLAAAQQLLSSMTRNDSKGRVEGLKVHSKQQQQVKQKQQQPLLRQQQQQQRKELEAKAFAAAAACCEGSAGAGSSCFIIRASSCAASFGAGEYGGNSLFDAAAAAYQELT